VFIFVVVVVEEDGFCRSGEAGSGVCVASVFGRGLFLAPTSCHSIAGGLPSVLSSKSMKSGSS
jgi:hypothetical protein